jgi:NAD(P)-dependent dehydrogenase (short-subunit alcohol dehydrogenase family)
VARHFGGVDVLVNNAGVGLQGGMLDTSLDDWDWILRINLGGVVHGCHFFVPHMVERKLPAHVVNVSSALGYFAAPGVVGYSTAKFGVFGLSESLRAELEPHGIAVSVICPGIIDTGIIKHTRIASEGGEKLRDRVQQAYTRRSYGPDKVARAIVRAVKRGTPVVPVSPEAWVLYYLKRVAPGLVGRLSHVIQRRVTGQAVGQSPSRPGYGSGA